MPFINEIPSAEDIEKYGLPFKHDLNVDMRLRNPWTIDRERNFYLYGGGLLEIKPMKTLFITVFIFI